MATPSTTIIYRIPETVATQKQTRSELVDNLLRAFDVDSLPNWTLDHRLFREPDTEKVYGGSPLTPKTKLHHLLQLNVDGRIADDVQLIYESPSDQSPAEPSKVRWDDIFVTTVPSSHFAAYSSMVSQKMQHQWLPRAAVFVPQGSAFRVRGEYGTFTIRVGEVIVRQHSAFRGVIVAISYSDHSTSLTETPGEAMDTDTSTSDDEDAKFARIMIDGFWRTLGFASDAVVQRDDGGGVKHGMKLEQIVAWQWATSLKVKP